jgi:hypothetical protein
MGTSLGFKLSLTRGSPAIFMGDSVIHLVDGAPSPLGFTEDDNVTPTDNLSPLFQSCPLIFHSKQSIQILCTNLKATLETHGKEERG